MWILVILKYLKLNVLWLLKSDVSHDYSYSVVPCEMPHTQVSIKASDVGSLV